MSCISHLMYLEAFTCAHVPDRKQSKLDDKSGKYVFIGFDSNSKGFKLYNPNNDKIINSRDANFNEKEAWHCGT